MLFTDDSLFFINETVENVIRLNNMLNDYCNALGLHISMNKSCILLSANTTEEQGENWKTHCRWTEEMTQASIWDYRPYGEDKKKK